MEVFLKFDWFGPDNTLYRRNPPGTFTELPESYEKLLPKTATILSKAKPYVAPEKDEDAGLTLRSYDTLRDASDAEQAINNAQAAVPSGRARKGA